MARPSDYRPEYCELVLKLGEEGKSIAQMAHACNVSRSNFHVWRTQFPEFEDAVSRARLAAQSWWEDAAQEHVVEDGSGVRVNSSLWAKSVAARFPEDYREKSTIEHTGKDGGAIKTETSLDEAARKIAFLLYAADKKQQETN